MKNTRYTYSGKVKSRLTIHNHTGAGPKPNKYTPHQGNKQKQRGLKKPK